MSLHKVNSNVNYWFCDSISPIYSQKEVVTLVVLGVLSFIFLCGAFYGYLINSLWLPIAHVMFGSMLLTYVAIATLVVIKHFKG